VYVIMAFFPVSQIAGRRLSVVDGALLALNLVWCFQSGLAPGGTKRVRQRNPWGLLKTAASIISAD
jgi:hypothetical protein